MLAKFNFPREALILSGAFKVIFNAVVKVVILVPAIMFCSVCFPIRIWCTVPLARVRSFWSAFPWGWCSHPWACYSKDVGRTLPMVAQFLMYISPVVFAMPTEGFTARLFAANPMSPLVLTARAWLTGSASPMPGAWAVVFFASIALLLVGWVLYRITMPVLVERMSS